MNKSNHTQPLATDEALPCDASGILDTLSQAGKHAQSFDYSQNTAVLQERLQTGERVPEEARANALGMSWPAYALVRGVQLARETCATVHLDDDDGNAVVFIEVVAGVAEFRAPSRKLIVAINLDELDRLSAGQETIPMH